MSVAIEADLQATGLPKRTLNTYRVMYAQDPPLSQKAVAKKVGLAPATVRLHVSRVEMKLEDPSLFSPSKVNHPELDETNPDQFADIVVGLSAPAASVARVARDLGISADAVTKIARKLEGELQPLKREVVEIRVEELTKQFGTLARDAIDAITPEKLDAASASQLAIVSGIASEKYLLLRGQPTQRVEVGHRHEMDEVVKMLLQEAIRRGVTIDVTPEGGVTASKSKYRNAHHRRDMIQLESGDPAALQEPA